MDKQQSIQSTTRFGKEQQQPQEQKQQQQQNTTPFENPHQPTCPALVSTVVVAVICTSCLHTTKYVLDTLSGLLWVIQISCLSAGLPLDQKLIPHHCWSLGVQVRCHHTIHCRTQSCHHPTKEWHQLILT